MSILKKSLALLIAFAMVFSVFSVAGVSVSAEEAYTELTLGVEQLTPYFWGGEIHYFSFTPEETGTYGFYSMAGVDTYCYLYDADMNYLSEDDDSGEDTNFYISSRFEAGKKYIFGVKFLNESTEGTFNVLLQKEVGVSSIDVEPISAISEYDGWWSEYYDYESGNYVEYFYYDWYNKLKYTVTMDNGDTVEGTNTWFEYNGKDYYLSTNCNQGSEEQWTVGNTYKPTISINDYTTEVSVTIVESPIENIVFEPISIIEGTNGETHTETDYETGEEMKYYRYNWHYNTKYTVYFRDGSTAQGNGTSFYYNEEWYYLSRYDDQSYENQWLAGNTYTAQLKVLEYTADVNVSITETPIESISFSSINMVENTQGDYEQGYNPDTGNYDEEYYRYWWWNKLSFTINFKDGSTQTGYGSGFFYNGTHYSFNTNDTQSYETPWTIGNTYTAQVSVMGYTTDVSVSITDTMIERIEVYPLSFVQETKGGFHNSTNPDTGEAQRYYRYYWWNEMEHVTYFKDGSSMHSNGTYIDYYGESYNITVTDSQSFENPWTAGNTYTAQISVMGYTTDVSVSIVDTMIEKIEFEPISIIEGTDGYVDTTYNPDTGNYDLEYFYYNWQNKLSYTITLKNGDTVRSSGTSFWYDGEYYSFNYTSSQNYNNRWLAGNTYTIPISVAGYSTQVGVTITESPVESIVVEPISIIEGTSGYQQYDDYYSYSWWNKIQYTVVFNDGTVKTGSGTGFNYNGNYYNLSYSDTQSYSNPWKAGNTYSTTVSLMGCSAEVQVSITETPIASVVFEPLKLLEETGGTHDTTYNPETGRYDLKYFRYSWYNYLKYTITFKDGSTVSGKGTFFNYQGNNYPLSYSDPQNSEDLWLPGNTYTVTLKAMGFSADAKIEIQKAPVVETIVSPIIIQEGTYCYDRWEYNPDLGTSESYTYYNWYEFLNVTVKLENGDVISVGRSETYYNDVKVYLSYNDPQSISSPFITGNTYNINVRVMGVDVVVPVSISSACIENGFTYVAQGGVAIITGCDRTDSVLTVPSTIGGYKVVGITDLGDALYYATEIVIPDSVTMLSSDLLHSYDTPLKKLTVGKGVSTLTVSMFWETDNLEEIVVSEDNPYYSAIDGVLYDKAITELLVYPSARKGDYKVPATVTDIEVLINDLFYLPEVDVDLGESKTGYVRVDGIIYTEDMKTVIDCSPKRTGKYVMPNSVTDIETFSLAETKLTDIKVSENVTEIVYYAFGGSVDLENIELPESLESINGCSFYKTGLIDVNIPDNVTSIGYDAFAKSKLRSISFSDNVTFVGAGAFDDTPLYNSKSDGVVYIDSCLYDYKGDMPSNTEITVPEGITVIAEDALRDQKNLKKLHLPASLHSISYASDAFAYCFGLEEITVDPDNEHFYVKNGMLYNSDNEVIWAPITNVEFEYYGDYEYEYGQGLYYYDFTAYCTYKDGSTDYFYGYQMEFSDFDPFHSGKQKVTVSLGKYSKTYTFTVASGGEENVNGDLNGDGVVNNTDVKTMAAIIAAGGSSNLKYDINGDGVVNVADYNSLGRIANDAAQSADFNGDGTADSQDVELFRNAMLMGDTNNLAYDINGDGIVNTADLIHLKKLAADPVEIKEYSDVNGDGSTDSNDLILLRKELLMGNTNNLDYDINGDGIVSAADVVRLKKLIAAFESDAVAGDANNDGTVTADDLAELKKKLLSGQQGAGCDVNKDSKVDVKDLIRLKKVLAGETDFTKKKWELHIIDEFGDLRYITLDFDNGLAWSAATNVTEWSEEERQEYGITDEDIYIYKGKEFLFTHGDGDGIFYVPISDTSGRVCFAGEIFKVTLTENNTLLVFDVYEEMTKSWKIKDGMEFTETDSFVV